MFHNQKVDIDKNLWVQILKDGELINNQVMDIFLYLLRQYKNEASGKEIARALGYKSHATLNVLIPNFSKRIIRKHPHIKIPDRYDGTKRLWHIPFLGSEEKNKFNWILRNELKEALVEVTNEIEEEYFFPEEITNQEETIIEGGYKQIIVTAYERDNKAREICLQKYGYTCQICGFNFEEVYGQIGKHKIHVHHKTPISAYKKEYVLDPQNDLIPVCPNCHLIIHSKKECFSIEEMKEIIEHNKKEEVPNEVPKI